MFDYLTYTDPQGITHPYLLEKWEVSDDLMTWTLAVRKGIQFNNGKELTADDVVFNFNQWLDKDVGSSIMGSMSYLDKTGVEKKDDYTVVLHLKDPSIFVPEHLFHYAACILPKEFGGDITREPIGTGAFTMEEYVQQSVVVSNDEKITGAWVRMVLPYHIWMKSSWCNWVKIEPQTWQHFRADRWIQLSSQRWQSGKH